tara:strand:+ start:76 stop:492 length:417 start_codon:yes stop_codon:yes gene_type:complete
MAGNEKIQLTLTKSDSQTSNNTQYRLDIAIHATDPQIADDLLVIRRSSPVEAVTQNSVARDQFWGIARWVDTSTLGIGTPNGKENFYLTSTWTLVFGNAATREESVEVLKRDATKLAKEIGSFVTPDNSNTIVFEQDY